MTSKNIIPIWDRGIYPDDGQFEALALLGRYWTLLNLYNQKPHYGRLADEMSCYHNRPRDEGTSRGTRISNFLQRKSVNFGSEDGQHYFDALARVLLDIDPLKYKWGNKNTQENNAELWNYYCSIVGRIFDLRRAYLDFDSQEPQKFIMEKGYYRSSQNTRSSIEHICLKEFKIKRTNFDDTADQFIGKQNEIQFACYRFATTDTDKIVRTRLVIRRPNDDIGYCQFLNIANNKPEDARDTEGVVIELNGCFHFIGKMKVQSKFASKHLVTSGLKGDGVTADGLLLTRATRREEIISSRFVLVKEMQNRKNKSDLRGDLGVFLKEDYTSWLKGTSINSGELRAKSKEMANDIIDRLKLNNIDDDLNDTMRDSLSPEAYQRVLKALSQPLRLPRI